ncbi:beta-ketoacyl synthase N-terminal-like domain-containing protein [Streptomyces sp. NPDC002896]|uniref:beta-ketoacyl synthase N-terminal-like domain-containing protein n=1 Tax=Streptomyces sp. NPDC002896 TaxID=3154438 RepID=UPI00332C7101
MRFEPIAVVGQGCVLPDALDPGTLWENIAAGRVSLSSAPDGRWRLPRSLAMGTAEDPTDRTWTDMGGYVRGFGSVFEPDAYLVGPERITGLDPVFQWVLHGARQALHDSGQQGPTPRAGLVLGNLSFPSAAMARYAEHVWRDEQPPAVRELWAAAEDREGGRPDARNRFSSGLPAHFAARALGLGAGAYAVDAACASSLYAVKLACDRLHDGTADLMLAGAVNCADDLFIHLGFCALSAMSRTGRSRPFHRGADGLVPAEGAAFVALMRLRDAVAEDRPVLGVIRGVGLSNDGRAGGLLTPAEDGQVRAMRLAYESAGIDPRTVSLAECHATGTQVGDAVEIRSLSRVFDGCDGLPVGSVKSNLGHPVTAAGVAGLLKVLGAMRAGIRPATVGADEPADALDGTPLRLLRENEPWDGLRRAAVSAFGFGGNNAHLVVDAWEGTPGTVCVPVPPTASPTGSTTAPTGPATVADPGSDGGPDSGPGPVAIVAIGARVGDGTDVHDLTRALLDGTPTSDPRTTVDVELAGLRFPPRDLERAHAQQLLVMEAAREAVREIALPRERTMVLVGMGCDPEVARYHARWRAAAWSGDGDVGEAFAPPLDAAGVLGTMPNVVANRLNAQLDLAGPSFSVSAEEASGLVALDLAARALAAGEADAAVVGAVDLSHEPVHQAALTELGIDRAPGDAAVALVLKRLTDARRDGDPVIALLGEPGPEPADMTVGAQVAGAQVPGPQAPAAPVPGPQAPVPQAPGAPAPSAPAMGAGNGKLGRRPGFDPAALFGTAHAATGLVAVACAALALHHRALPGAVGEPAAPALGIRTADVVVTPLDAPPARVRLSAADDTDTAAWLAAPPPRLHVYSGRDLPGTLAALAAGHESDTGPARLVIVAATAEELTERAAAARRWLSGESIRPDGVAFREKPLDGEVAFVYTNGSAAYPGMGRELMLAFPAITAELESRCGPLEETVGWAYRNHPAGDGDGDAPRHGHVLDQIWGAALLAQFHTEISRHVLGIAPGAVLGYSSGESAALVSMRAWRDVRSLVTDIRGSEVFARGVVGELDAIRRAWAKAGVRGDRWASYIVNAPVDAVRQLIEGSRAVHLMAVNAPDMSVVGGEETECERLLAGLHSLPGAAPGHAIRLDYDIAVHAPEVEEVRQEWRRLHHRPTEAVPGVRFYTGATGDWYTPTPDAAAEAITAQAVGTINFDRMVENAYADGVRVFVEHGPRGLCTGWIDRILGDRDHLAVSLDASEGQGIRRLVRSIAGLVAAGVRLNAAALFDHFASIAPPRRAAGSRLTFPAHPPTVRVRPPAAGAGAGEPSDAGTPSGRDREAAASAYVTAARPGIQDIVQDMPPAPWLPPVPVPLTALPLPRPEAGVQEMPRAPWLPPSSLGAPPASLQSHPEASLPAQPDAGTTGEADTAAGSAIAALLPPSGEAPAVPASAVLTVPVPAVSAVPAVATVAVVPTAAGGPQWAPPPAPADQSPAAAAVVGTARLAGLQAATAAYQNGLASAFQEFLSQQAGVHQEFLAMRQRAAAALLHGAPSGRLTAAPAVGPSSATAGEGTRVAGAPAPAGAPAARPAPALAAAVPLPVPAPAAPAATTSTPAAVPAAPAATAPVPSAAAPALPTTPAPPHAHAHHPGPKFTRDQLEQLASGRISELFGPLFAAQDGLRRQTRMPQPPMLLADRVTGIDAVPASMGTGTIWTETDVRPDSWYLDPAGRMPAGFMVEAGQADLLLISWLGADLRGDGGDRVYRLLGCELTFHGSPPVPGETLRFEIRINGHGEHDGVRLFFFRYDCYVDDELRLTVRDGQAGFFTDAELAGTGGVLWDPAADAPDAAAPLAPPALPLPASRRSFGGDAVRAFAEGRPYDCFGPEWRPTRAHVRTPRIADGRMLLLGEVTDLDATGGPWGRGYLRAETPIRPDDWFFAGHFKNDPCMPGTLMLEGCLQAMAFHLAALGFTADRDGWRFEPVPDTAYRMLCRGQVTPDSRLLTYEVFVRELSDGAAGGDGVGEPVLVADVLCTVDGVKAFLARGLGLRLVRDWPLEHWRLLGPPARQETGAPVPLPSLGGLAGHRENTEAVYGYPELLASAWGRPSEAFGTLYGPAEDARRVPRLPGPPYHFISRIVSVDGPPGSMEAGVAVVAEYDVSDRSWFFEQNNNPVMPTAVLMEIALQPCGWLASYAGCALSSDRDLLFRNLDGTATVSGHIGPDTATVRTRAELREISRNGDMIIVSFEVECTADGRPVFRASTVFGFFPPEAFADQAGLPPTDAELLRLAEPCDRTPALRTSRLAGPMLLMVDRVTGYWPQGGASGLGRLRAEKDVDPGEWFFKAHFLSDPVQPGSLGVEAMCQLLQTYLIETGAGSGLRRPRFELLTMNRPLTWKYRGQVVPANERVTVELEVHETGEAERGRYAVAEAWLWVDGKRIYHVRDLGMRVVEGDRYGDDGQGNTGTSTNTGAEIVLDPAADGWLSDHRPTWTVPALPGMSTLDLLAQAAEAHTDRPVTSLRDVRLHRWIRVTEPLRLRTEVTATDGYGSGGGEFTVTLLTWREAATAALSRFEPAATATVRVGERAAADGPPEPFAPLQEAAPAEDPYASGALFHGPAFQYLVSVRAAASGASGVLDAGRGAVPRGLLHPGLLDAALHVIPHDQLWRWSPEIGRDVAAFPHRIAAFDVYGPMPSAGDVHVEARFAGFDQEDRRLPAFDLQLSAGGRLLVAFRLVEILVPKGRIATADPVLRRTFLRDRQYAAGIGLSVTRDGVTRLSAEDADRFDWLPGTVAEVYGLPPGARGRDHLAEIAVRDHIARIARVHPSAVVVADELTRGWPDGRPDAAHVVRVGRDGDRVEVRDAGPSQLVQTY